MKMLILIRASVCVIAAIGGSLAQGIHDGMKSWEWWKFAALAIGAGATALAGFLDTSFGRLWHKEPEPPLTEPPKAP